MKYNQKREQIYDYIKNYQTTNGFPPTIREIAKAVKISSTATVAYNVDCLCKSGRITKSNNKNRSLVITEFSKEEETTSIPLIGKIAAGIPITAVEYIEDTYVLPKNLFYGDNLFMLTVSGDSMINAGIFSGDKIIVRQQNNAERGEIVVALIDDEATVKRYYPERGYVRLQPENPNMEPIIVPSVRILGKVIGSIRKFN